MATCKECVHWEACVDLLQSMGYTVDGDGCDADNRCKTFKDRSRFMELPPVKVGDTAYFIIGGKVYKAEVHFIRWEQHKQYGIHSEISASIIPNYSVGASFDDFGKTVFLTREEAEAALAKMG